MYFSVWGRGVGFQIIGITPTKKKRTTKHKKIQVPDRGSFQNLGTRVVSRNVASIISEQLAFFASLFLREVYIFVFQMWDLTTALEIASKQSGETAGETSEE